MEIKERCRRLIDYSPQPMATHRDGKFIDINPAAVRLLGANSADEVIGKSIFEIIHPDFMELARERTRLVSEQKYVGSMEYKIIRLDGQEIDAEIIGLHDESTQSTLALFNDITNRKKVERALQESEERYRRLVELSPMAIAVLNDVTISYLNPAGLKMMGVNRQEDIIGTTVTQWIHPNDLDLAKERIQTTLRDGYCPSGEYQVVRFDGITIDISVTSIYDYKSSTIELVFADITERKQAERALLQSEELNRLLIELSPEAVIVHSDFTFDYVNPAGLALFGASSLDDIIGRSLLDRVHPDFQEETKLRLAAVYEQKSGASQIEQKIVRLDGTIIDIEVVSAPLPYLGKNAGLTLIRDISNRKQVEADRKEMVQLIRESEDRYYRLQTSLDRFSSDLFGVMRVSEMERRLIKEIEETIKATKISLIEVDQRNNVSIKYGNHHIANSILEDIANRNLRALPLCELFEVQDGYFLKIADIRGTIDIICIGEKPRTLQITSKRVWLKTITRYVSVLYDNFRLIEDLTKEMEELASNQATPSWLLRLLFNLAENERKRLSQDLHDAALQEQIIWYRKLDQLSTDPSISQAVREQLQQITQGLLDVIYQIRITCNELRPPMLKEEGIVSSLEALFEFTQMRADFSIGFNASEFAQTLNDEQLLGLYRIVQELLANATKHSNATHVMFTLSSDTERIRLVYEDNGIGMDVGSLKDSFGSMGMYGMEQRVRSMDGNISLHSSPNNGLVVHISIPVSTENPASKWQ